MATSLWGVYAVALGDMPRRGPRRTIVQKDAGGRPGGPFAP